jgi:hypothetical protein
MCTLYVVWTSWKYAYVSIAPWSFSNHFNSMLCLSFSRQCKFIFAVREIKLIRITVLGRGANANPLHSHDVVVLFFSRGKLCMAQQKRPLCKSGYSFHKVVVLFNVSRGFIIIRKHSYLFLALALYIRMLFPIFSLSAQSFFPLPSLFSSLGARNG